MHSCRLMAYKSARSSPLGPLRPPDDDEDEAKKRAGMSSDGIVSAMFQVPVKILIPEGNVTGAGAPELLPGRADDVAAAPGMEEGRELAREKEEANIDDAEDAAEEPPATEDASSPSSSPSAKEPRVSREPVLPFLLFGAVLFASVPALLLLLLWRMLWPIASTQAVRSASVSAAKR